MILKPSKKLTLFLVVCFVIISAIVAFETMKDAEDGDKIYENKELGFSFSYPGYWGRPSVLDSSPDFVSIEFVKDEEELEIVPGIAEDYFATPLVQAFSKDYEVYETILPFDEHYNQKISALEFCRKFAQKTLAHSSCQEEIVDGHKIASVIYGYYLEEGMMGDGNELYFEQIAFVPLANEEFPGLEAVISVYTFEDEKLKTKSQEELKEFAKQELDKILSGQASVYTKDKIKAFEEFVRSFKF